MRLGGAAGRKWRCRIDVERNRPWARKHDRKGAPHIPRAKKIVYPTSLEDLIRVCKNHPRTERLHAGGTHWSLSNAAVSDHTFIETNDPRNTHRAMSRTLHNVVPRCMEPTLLNSMGQDHSPKRTFVHVEAGKRIYQLYAELDQVDSLQTAPNTPETLAAYMKRVHVNFGYAGPWAFRTLGGAGGQTIVGAISTGTHGGDFRLGAVGDSVRAVHIVVDGGKHFWIEPLHGPLDRPLTSEARLRAEYGQPKYGGPANFGVFYDDELFYSVLVSVGRFGVIYSVVLEARPQYSLYELRRLANWQEIKHLIKHPSSTLYYPEAEFVPPTATDRNRFLQIALCLTPHGNFQLNRVGITQRWEVPLPTPPAQPQGRKERVGRAMGVDPRTGCTIFERAGKSHGYTPPDHPGHVPQPSVLEAACADPSFLKGLIDRAARDLKRLIDSDGAAVGAGIAAVAVIGGTGLLILLGALVGLVALLREYLDDFDDDTRLGQHLENLKNLLLDPPISHPKAKEAGLFVWQLIAYEIFETLQKARKYEGISYAVMDQHDYLNKSCEVNGDSIEVFFNAVDDRLIAFVDALIAFERNQELRGRAFVGYASLRFTTSSDAVLGMLKHPLNCAVEVAGLKDVSGSQDLINYASRLALHPDIGAMVHWGQHNEYKAADVERLFGRPINYLAPWKRALARLTADGRLNGFSSRFTQRRGLEVVPPPVHAFSVDRADVEVGEPVTVSWDASSSPDGSTVALIISSEGVRTPAADSLPLVGSYEFRPSGSGEHCIALEVRPATSSRRTAVATTLVTVSEQYQAET